MPKVTIEKEINPYKTISQVAELMDVETHVLRFWEKEFAQIKPQRSNGRRYYDQEAVNTISQIKSLLYEQGFTIEGAKKHLKGKSDYSSHDILSQLKHLETLLNS